MRRQQTLYGKILLIFLAVILLAGVLIGALSSSAQKRLAVNNAFESLTNAANYIADIYEESYSRDDAGEKISEAAEAMSALEDVELELCDKYGASWFRLNNTTEDITEGIAEDNIAQLFSGETERAGRIVSYDINFYATPIVSVRVPLNIDNTEKGSVLVTKRLNEFERSMRIFYKRLILGCSAAVVLAVILYGILYKKIRKDFDNINYASRAFARGDFKARVSVKSDDDIGRLSETFNTMAEELEKYESTRQSFVANVSHELRSPLTSVQGFVQGILDGTIPKEKEEQYLTVVLTETRRMTTLIGDLLDLSKIESGQFPLELTDFDISELMRRILINFLTKIEEKHINVSASIPDDKIIVTADVNRISQVLTNLIDNAVKFCEQNGVLKIWTYQSDGRIHINISNTGILISQEDIPYVFDRFFKADKSHNRKAGGTGIGLSIVKNIIQQHGEKIWVNSRPGTGTVFTFTLRIKEDSKS